MRIAWITAVVAVSAGMLAGAGPAPARAEEGMTLAALRIAYQRELDTERRYAAFAERAALEGYLGLRDLFDALRIAETRHARLHAIALEWMDVTPAAQPSAVTVESTAWNLRYAYESEVDERNLVYGRFTEYARAECLYDVLAGFRYARDAETTHARALADAYFDRAEMRGARSYYVCMGCGAVRGQPSGGPCDCGGSAAAFTKVRGPDTAVRMVADR